MRTLVFSLCHFQALTREHFRMMTFLPLLPHGPPTVMKTPSAGLMPQQTWTILFTLFPDLDWECFSTASKSTTVASKFPIEQIRQQILRLVDSFNKTCGELRFLPFSKTLPPRFFMSPLCKICVFYIRGYVNRVEQITLFFSSAHQVSLFVSLSSPTLIKRFFPPPWYSADDVRRSSSTAALFRF